MSDIVERLDRRILTERDVGTANDLAKAAAEITRLREQIERKDAALAGALKCVFQFRDMLIAVHDGLEDEGDRVYLGSSNHAELIHEAWHFADAIKWDALMEENRAALTPTETRK